MQCGCHLLLLQVVRVEAVIVLKGVCFRVDYVSFYIIQVSGIEKVSFILHRQEELWKWK